SNASANRSCARSSSARPRSRRAAGGGTLGVVSVGSELLRVSAWIRSEERCTVSSHVLAQSSASAARGGGGDRSERSKPAKLVTASAESPKAGFGALGGRGNECCWLGT